MNTPVPLLAARGIRKRYGQVEALRGADLEVGEGEVHALIGDNGAGKSTLVKALSGVVTPDEGTIELRGERVAFGGPRDAQGAGIETVYQDLALAPSLDAGANIFLGREPLRGGFRGRIGFLDRPRMRREAAHALEDLGVELPSLEAEVGTMSGGQRQAVAVARAAVWGTALIIMDEPTAALGVRQTEVVLSLIRRVCEQKGVSVLLISHNMAHVLRVADTITVLRLGRRAAVRRALDTSLEELTLLMAGLGNEADVDPEDEEDEE
ncbi:MAG: sugar ABC transporter ATP-binding protein [Actinobacteria bacterium]|nr:sugar ABC transporter ATP-binding protein [Actinomycetota bacterium]